MISNSDFEKLWFLYKTRGQWGQVSVSCGMRGQVELLRVA